MRVALGMFALAVGQALAAGCGDVTGDVIVRATASPAGCAGDADCAAPNPRCDRTSGACVACLGADDCSGGQLCALPANVCVERCADADSCGGERSVCDADTGLCRACSLDEECAASTPHCQTSGACVECLQHADCSGDDDGDEDDDDDDERFCSPEGRCVECLDDGHCDDVGESCNASAGECAEPCSAADPCGSDDPICDESVGFCVECRNDLDCEEGELCRGSECVD
jgi:hypothetical protein